MAWSKSPRTVVRPGAKLKNSDRLTFLNSVYIADIEADLHDDNTVYVAVQNFKRGDFRPYVLKSTDRGQNWSLITGNLPQRGSVYCLKQDHVNPKLLFCGTEFGCFTTVDGGEKWFALRSGLPTIAIRDMQIQRRENDLVLGSFGRGFYILDDYSPLETSSLKSSTRTTSSPIKKGEMYQVVSVMGVNGRGFQGANFYTAPNPEYGVTFTFHFKKNCDRKSRSVNVKIEN